MSDPREWFAKSYSGSSRKVSLVWRQVPKLNFKLTGITLIKVFCNSSERKNGRIIRRIDMIRFIMCLTLAFVFTACEDDILNPQATTTSRPDRIMICPELKNFHKSRPHYVNPPSVPVTIEVDVEGDDGRYFQQDTSEYNLQSSSATERWYGGKCAVFETRGYEDLLGSSLEKINNLKIVAFGNDGKRVQPEYLSHSRTDDYGGFLKIKLLFDYDNPNKNATIQLLRATMGMALNRENDGGDEAVNDSTINEEENLPRGRGSLENHGASGLGN